MLHSTPKHTTPSRTNSPQKGSHSPLTSLIEDLGSNFKVWIRPAPPIMASQLEIGPPNYLSANRPITLATKS